MSKSAIITDDDAELLENPSAADILMTEFMEPLGLSTAALAEALEVPRPSIDRLIANECAIDAELDLRLGRYFGMSEGFFLRLQNRYDLEEAKRNRGAMIERITRRAA